MLALNTSLIICILVIITGVLISNYVFPDITTSSYNMTFSIHKFMSYFMLFIILIHVLFHYKYIIGGIKNIINNIKLSSIKKGILLSFAFLFVCIILYIPISAFFSLNKKTVNLNDDKQTIIEDKTNSQSLTDYLSSLRCTGCNKHCLLISPGCNTGETQKEEATKAYNEETSYDNSNTEKKEDAKPNKKNKNSSYENEKKYNKNL